MSTLADVNPQLKALTDAGVAVWLDQLGRSLVSGGELKRMVEEESLHGVTSNPSIFEKSILGTADYDDAIEQLARADKSAKEIYDTLAVADVQAAADVLAVVHERTGGRDGFVSLEVAPDLARDTDGHDRLGPHLLAGGQSRQRDDQDPGHARGRGRDRARRSTRASTSTSRCCSGSRPTRRSPRPTSAGWSAVTPRASRLEVNSVASFFVSRVDTLVDKQLDALGGDAAKLKGKAALANARAAYARFMEIFSGERWDTLAAAGAAVQRPLWASTGVKNPAYPDTLYVDELIAPYTVNTMPLATLNAVADHGKVAGATARDRSERRAQGAR